MTVMNATLGTMAISGLSKLPVWGLTIIVGVVIAIVLFMALKGFRKLVLGAVFTVPALIILKIATWISKKTVVENNYVPMKWLGYVLGFSLLTLLIGTLAYKKYGKSLEEAWKK